MTTSTSDIYSLTKILAETVNPTLARETALAMIRLSACTPIILEHCIQKGFAFKEAEQAQLIYEMLLLVYSEKGSKLVDLFNLALSDSVRKALIVRSVDLYDTIPILSAAYGAASTREQIYLMTRLLEEAKDLDDVRDREELIRSKLLPQLSIWESPAVEDQRAVILDAMTYGKRDEPRRYISVLKTLGILAASG